jgi:hypothetical protein
MKQIVSQILYAQKWEQHESEKDSEILTMDERNPTAMQIPH